MLLWITSWDETESDPDRRRRRRSRDDLDMLSLVLECFLNLPVQLIEAALRRLIVQSPQWALHMQWHVFVYFAPSDAVRHDVICEAFKCLRKFIFNCHLMKVSPASFKRWGRFSKCLSELYVFPPSACFPGGCCWEQLGDSVLRPHAGLTSLQYSRLCTGSL